MMVWDGDINTMESGAPPPHQKFFARQGRRRPSSFASCMKTLSYSMFQGLKVNGAS
jgi:hypothetical protein